MPSKDIGQEIARLRKERNMTQLQLADLMNVTDKAVSKWERGLSYPSFKTIQKLAEVLEVSLENFIDIESEDNMKKEDLAINENLKQVTKVIFKAISLAMGIAVVVLSILKELDISSGFIMLGIGLFSLALDSLRNNK